MDFSFDTDPAAVEAEPARPRGELLPATGTASASSSIFEPESSASSSCVASLPNLTSVGYRVDPALPYSVFSWASPLAGLLDDFPALSAERGQQSVRQRALFGFVSRHRTYRDEDLKGRAPPPVAPVPVTATEGEVVEAELARKALDAMKDSINYSYSRLPPDAEDPQPDTSFVLYLFNRTHGAAVVDASELEQRAPLFARNAWGRALTEARENSDRFQDRRRVSGAALWALSRAVEMVDPRGLLEAARSSPSPLSELLRQSMLAIGARASPELLRQPDLTLADAVRLADSLGTAGLGSFPFIVDPDDALLFVMRNMGRAAELLRTRPVRLASAVVERALEKRGSSMASLTTSEFQRRRDELARDIAARSYLARPALAALVEEVSRRPGLWFDPDYLASAARAAPYVPGDGRVGPDAIISPVHQRDPPYYIGDMGFPSTAHVVSFLLSAEAFLGRTVDDMSPDDLEDEYVEAMRDPATNQAFTPLDAANHAYGRVVARARDLYLEDLREERRRLLESFPWAADAARVAAAAGVAVAQDTERNADDSRALIDWAVRHMTGRALGAELLDVTPESVQAMPLTRWLVRQRVAELLNLSTLVFDMFSAETEQREGLVAVKALTVYHAAMEGAWTPPNRAAHIRPRLDEAFLDSFGRYYFGRASGRSQRFEGSDADAVRYAAETAVAELLERLAPLGAAGSCGHRHLFHALVEMVRRETSEEGEAYAAATEQDLARALSFIAKRLGALTIATNSINPPRPERLVHLAVVALTAGGTEAALEGAAVDLTPLFSGAPLYRVWDAVNSESVSFVGYAQNTWPALAAAIDQTARNTAALVWPRRRMLSSRKVLAWSRSPPVSSAIATAFETRQLRSSLLSDADPSEPPVGREFVERVQAYLRGALASRLSSLDEAGQGLDTPRHLAQALVSAAERIDAARRIAGGRFATTGDLVFVAASVLFPSEEALLAALVDPAIVLAGERSAEPVSRGAVMAVADRVAQALLGRGASPRAVAALIASEGSPQTDLFHYRPTDYSAPGSEAFFPSTGGPFDADDGFPARYIFPERAVGLVAPRRRGARLAANTGVEYLEGEEAPLGAAEEGDLEEGDDGAEYLENDDYLDEDEEMLAAEGDD